jgi:inosine triphosphate pyrophosphatase
MGKILFASGNINKAREAEAILGLRVELVRPGIEVQGSAAEIAASKLSGIESEFPVIADDTALCLECLNGMPGSYIDHFIRALGADGIYRIARAMGNNAAEAVCTIALLMPGAESPVFFEGRVTGSIVAPRGKPGFSWDPVFMPSGLNQTYAEMEQELKNRISHRALALQKLKAEMRL